MPGLADEVENKPPVSVMPNFAQTKENITRIVVELYESQQAPERTPIALFGCALNGCSHLSHSVPI